MDKLRYWQPREDKAGQLKLRPGCETGTHYGLMAQGSFSPWGSSKGMESHQ